MAVVLLRSIRTLLPVLLLGLGLLPLTLQAQTASPSTSETTAQEKQAPHQYSLPPEKLRRAIAYASARYWLHFAGELYSMGVLLAILALGISAKFRNWALATSTRRFPQAVVFVALLMLTNDILNLPLGVYGQHLELAFDQSVQSWPSWLWDWTKGELMGITLAIVLVYILYAVIRRSPRRWWFYFWICTLPILFTIMFLEPLVIEPMFYHFEPLASKHAALVGQLEKVVARGGLAIPPDHMFEMRASEKVTSLNAYVSGLGATKRVVVWDTTLDSMTTPEILFVFGHEMGHYVLGHVRDSLLLLSLLFLILLFTSYHMLGWMVSRWGAQWRIQGIADWASLPALLLIAGVMTFVTEPLVNGYSRWQEHQADIYGIEVTHGIVPDSKSVAAHSFQLLGEVGLDEPDPNPFIEFWLYSHPSISERIAFTEIYDPWTNGAPKYVK